MIEAVVPRLVLQYEMGQQEEIEREMEEWTVANCPSYLSLSLRSTLVHRRSPMSACPWGFIWTAKFGQFTDAMKFVERFTPERDR